MFQMQKLQSIKHDDEISMNERSVGMDL